MPCYATMGFKAKAILGEGKALTQEITSRIFKRKLLIYTHFMLYLKCTKGATWLRRGLQNQRCMPRMRTLVNQTQLNINANDENFAGGEAIAA